jgi:hypothetical protein
LAEDQLAGNDNKNRLIFSSAFMSGFGSEAAAYVVGILVGVLVGIAALALLGWYLYRKFNLANVQEEDEELRALRREASMYEVPRQAERDDPLRPSTSGVQPEMEESTGDGEGGSRRPTIMTAAAAATIKSRAASQRKQAWRF